MNLEHRVCPVCDAASADADLFLSASYDPTRIGTFSFASRKTPEFMSYRLMRCRHCATVYAEAAPPADVLARAYSAASYDSSDEAALAAESYISALRASILALAQRGRALEIGTGSGVFLERLLDIGFAEVVGVEPSLEAIAASSPRIRGAIREGIFDEADFSPASFDLICCFMTLEHVADPRQLVRSCKRLLRPGGVLAFVTHDYTALLNRAMGRRSPIIDIEHLQLFCPASISHLVKREGFQSPRISSFCNEYALRYWLRLAPLPVQIKPMILGFVRFIGVDEIKIRVNVGNMMTVCIND